MSEINEQFIGRGEKLVKRILENPWNIEEVKAQVNITKLIPSSGLEYYDQEILNHNFDFVAIRKNLKSLVIEVNYKHREKAAKKWQTIFVPLLEQFGYYPVIIDDYDCDSLFSDHSMVNYRDIKDVANQLKKAGVALN